MPLVVGIAAWSVLALLPFVVLCGLRRRRGPTLLALASVILTVLAVEAALRLAYPPSWRPLRKVPSRAYHHVDRPDARMYYGRVEGEDIVVRTNEDGLRSDRTREQFSHLAERIVVLGDSFTFGAGVRQEAAFPQALERLLRARLGRDDVGVLNGGTISYSPLLAVRAFDGVVVRYRPTLVLYVLDVTDIGDDYDYERELFAGGGEFDWSGVETDSYHGALGQLGGEEVLKTLARPLSALGRLAGIAPRPTRRYDWYDFQAEIGGQVERNRFFIYRHPLDETRGFFDRTFGYLARLADRARAAGADFVLVVAPRHRHWNPAECPDDWESDQYAPDEPYPFEYFRYFEQRRADAPFEIFTLLPAFRESREFPLVFRDDPHWNEAGHALVARTLAAHVIGSGRLAALP